MSRISRGSVVTLCALTMLLAACNGVGIYTAASGTQVEARQVVALVYAQGSDSEIAKLAYSGGDLSRAIKRIRDRYSELKPLLDGGVIGNTADGFVKLLDPTGSGQLHELLCAENRDRSLLYNQAAAAVGHGNESCWLPYASDTFGQEWIGQGQPGWWWLDEKGRWRRN